MRRVVDLDAGLGGCRSVLRTPLRKVYGPFRVRSLPATGGMGLVPGWRCWLVAFVGPTAAAPAAMTGLTMAAMHPEMHERHPSKSKNQHPVAGEEVRHLHHLFPCRCPVVGRLLKWSEELAVRQRAKSLWPYPSLTCHHP